MLKTLEDEVCCLLWTILDQFIATKAIEADYLQIFRLKTEVVNGKYILSITHEQEVPSYVNQLAGIYQVAKAINEKVYVISDYDEDGNEYSTMLLADEY